MNIKPIDSGHVLQAKTLKDSASPATTSLFDGPGGVPPLDIPWRLLATTGPTVRDGEDESFAGEGASSVSISDYEVPRMLTQQAYPNQRVVFFRFTVTVAPGTLMSARLVSKIPEGKHASVARELLKRTDPARALVLDVSLSAKRTFFDRENRPAASFLSASPLARDVVQSFETAQAALDAAADSLVIGDSMSQMSESSSLDTDSTVTTDRTSARWGPVFFSVGGSHSKTVTDATTTGHREGRTEQASSDQTSTSEARRSSGFQSQVTNILALLRGRYVGTASLQFTMRPRPLTTPPRERFDSEAWYADVLQSASRGLDGVQDFFGVAVIDADTGPYSVKARLRVAYCADHGDLGEQRAVAPSEVVGSLSMLASGTLDDVRFTPNEKFRPAFRGVSKYLMEAFPLGTPVQALDADIMRAVEVVRDHCPPAWQTGEGGVSFVTRASKVMGPTPVTIRKWIVPKFVFTEQAALTHDLRREAERTPPPVGPTVGMADLYVFVRVAWTEFVPWPPSRSENEVEPRGPREQNDSRWKLDPSYFGRMRPLLRFVDLPYKPMMAVLQDAATFRMQSRVMNPLSTGTAYATTHTLEVEERQAAKMDSRSAMIAGARLRPVGTQTIGGRLDLVPAWNMADASLEARLSAHEWEHGGEFDELGALILSRLEQEVGVLEPEGVKWARTWLGESVVHDVSKVAGDDWVDSQWLETGDQVVDGEQVGEFSSGIMDEGVVRGRDSGPGIQVPLVEGAQSVVAKVGANRLLSDAGRTKGSDRNVGIPPPPVDSHGAAADQGELRRPLEHPASAYAVDRLESDQVGGAGVHRLQEAARSREGKQ